MSYFCHNFLTASALAWCLALGSWSFIAPMVGVTLWLEDTGLTKWRAFLILSVLITAPATYALGCIVSWR